MDNNIILKAESGDAEAQFYLAGEYFEKKEYKQAFTWYMKAAEKGNVYAQFNLGIMYHLGQGVSQDEEQAFIWYEKAAQQGNKYAQHNLGAIIRTANLAGAQGVIIPKRRAVGLTATVAKTSAGAINYTPVAKVTNISQTIEELKKQGLWFVCADMGGETMYNLNLKGPIGLVIGNEGNGVSRLVKDKCDFIASIPMKGDIDSLNASVAAGVLAYEIVRQRLNQGVFL